MLQKAYLKHVKKVSVSQISGVAHSFLFKNSGSYWLCRILCMAESTTYCCRSSNGLYFLISLYALWVENFGIIILCAPLGFFYFYVHGNIDKLNYIFIALALSSIFFIHHARA